MHLWNKPTENGLFAVQEYKKSGLKLRVNKDYFPLTWCRYLNE